ncbi:MAG TPA: CAP domain-containing protein [Polyangiaceae bacterium]|jgi:hypothetical protein
MSRRLALASFVLAACAASAGPAPTSSAPVASATVSADPPVATASPTVTARAPTPSGPLTLSEARRYMLELINRDRATEHLAPVALDEGVASRAGQAHAEDMAHLGYLGHWGSDGSTPEQRITEAGGADVDFENAYCVTDEKTRPLDPSPRFDRAEIERAESMFFGEKPPNDGHRKTILGKWRKRVGIGIALARPVGNEILVPCISQEFVDTYGTYDALPKSIKAGRTLHVAGTLENDVRVGAVGIVKLDDPKPLPVAELNRRRNYPQPEPSEMFWPHGFKTRIELQTSGQHFSIDIPMPSARGTYEISVWAQHPGERSFGAVSLRTVRLD